MSAAQSTPPVAGELVILLTGKAEADLAAVQQRSGLSRTDLVNRAITAYDFLDQVFRSGDTLHLIRDGETYAVEFL